MITAVTAHDVSRDDHCADTVPPESEDLNSLRVLAHYPVEHTESRDGSSREDLDAHVARSGRHCAAGVQGDSLLDDLETARVTGHGGGHFPVAAKWRSVLKLGGACVVVANGAEGEPLSAKDAAVIQLRPHEVLDGAQFAAQATAAHEIVIWLPESATSSLRSIESALRERQAASYQELSVRIVSCPARYLSGESTAVAGALAGGPALPSYQPKPGPPIDQDGRVALVHNVETLTHVAQTGIRGFADPRLVTVFTGNFRVVATAGRAATLGSAIATARASAGLGPEFPSAVLLGGYGGQWVPWPIAASLPTDERALRGRGFSLGAGVIAPLPEDACGVAETASILQYLADQSAKQCGPCMFGLPAISNLVQQLAFDRMKPSHWRRMETYLAQLGRRGACAHPDGAMRMLKSALTTFADDIRSHAATGRCLHSGRDPVFPILAAP